MSNGEEQQQQQQQSAGDQAREGIREGVRAVTGFLAALKDAIEETIRDVRDTGDLDPNRAKEAMKSTMKRAQNAVDNVADRLDFVPRKDFDALREEVEALRLRVTELENRGGTSGGARTIPIDGA
jgi:polyhydroxyalkanoate synthesis regulator phasin